MAIRKEIYPNFHITLRSELDDVNFDDVVYCAFVRAPFYKGASFCLLHINVNSIWAKSLYNDMSIDPTLNKLQLTINEVNEKDENEITENDPSGIEIIHKLYKSEFICLNITNLKNAKDYQINMADINSFIGLVLVNPIFYDLEIKHKFNFKIEDSTAFQGLEKFEEKLNEYYKDSFDFNKIGIDKYKSDYEYEELLVHTKTDMDIPQYLLYGKKMITTPGCFYFFDDFCLKKGKITAHLINLSDIDSMETFDLLKNDDVVLQIVKLTEDPITDLFKDHIHELDNIIYKTKDGVFRDPEPDVKNTPRPYINEYDNDNIDLTKNGLRKVVSMGTEWDSQAAGRKKAKIYYVPDSKALADKRIENYKELLKKIKNLSLFQIKDAYFDWIQFGRLYNMELGNEEDQTKYNCTPINIINVFYKYGNKFNIVHHFCKTLMVEYYPDKAKQG